MNTHNKKLSIFQGIGIVITTLLGSGIFIVPLLSASLSKGNSLIAWIIMSIAIIPIAYIFGVLGGKYPHVEGSAFFVEQAFGKKMGRIIGLMYTSIIPIGPPVVIITGASYLQAFFPTNLLLLLSLAMIGFVYILNQYNFSISSNIGLAIVVAILVIIGIMTFSATSLDNPIEFEPMDMNFFTSLGTIFWCFVGIEAVSHLSSEFKQGQFLKIIIWGVLIAGALYALVAYAVLAFQAYGTETENMQSLMYIFQSTFPKYGKAFLAIIGFLICLIAVNLYVASSVRLLSSYAKKKLSSRLSLLLVTLAITTTTVIKILFDVPIDTLILYANGVFVVIYFFVALSGVILLRNKDRIIALCAVFMLSVIIVGIGFNMVYAVGVFILLLIGIKLSKIFQ